MCIYHVHVNWDVFNFTFFSICYKYPILKRINMFSCSLMNNILCVDVTKYL